MSAILTATQELEELAELRYKQDLGGQSMVAAGAARRLRDGLCICQKPRVNRFGICACGKPRWRTPDLTNSPE